LNFDPVPSKLKLVDFVIGSTVSFIPAAGDHACVPKHQAARSASSNAGTPACRHGLWPWRNAPSYDRPVPAYDRNVAPRGVGQGTTGFARGAPF
jgi:hypothetical protein